MDFLLVGATIAGSIGLLHVVVPCIYDIGLTDEAVEIRLFRKFAIWRYPLSEIVGVDRMPLWKVVTSGQLFARNSGWTNRFGSQVVILRLRNGWDIALTPRHPERFADDVQSRIGDIAIKTPPELAPSAVRPEGAGRPTGRTRLDARRD